MTVIGEPLTRLQFHKQVGGFGIFAQPGAAFGVPGNGTRFAIGGCVIRRRAHQNVVTARREIAERKRAIALHRDFDNAGHLVAGIGHDDIAIVGV